MALNGRVFELKTYQCRVAPIKKTRHVDATSENIVDDVRLSLDPETDYSLELVSPGSATIKPVVPIVYLEKVSQPLNTRIPF